MSKESPLVLEAIEGFGFTGKLLSYERYGSGHINDTYKLAYDVNGMGRLHVLLQRLSKAMTPHSDKLMENITGITGFLYERILSEGGDPYRETLNVIYTKDGRSFYEDSEGEAWRAYMFVEGATGYDQTRSPKDFYESGVSFGNFQRLLCEYDAAKLFEAIPDFHNTRNRLRLFKEALNEDPLGRAKDIQKEVDFYLSHEDLADELLGAADRGEIPIRVTHNDTKLNNVLIDDRTSKGICVIDLDTVMPGLSMYDFGDSIRFGASTALEDEKDLSLVTMDLGLYETFAKGFLEGAGGYLTENELSLFPAGAKVMTYECGMRFLTDYILGDKYFHIKRPEHNLDRARTQMKLVMDMEDKWDEMRKILEI